jgi:MFS family permease
MPELRGPITAVVIIVGMILAMLLGDFLGDRIGRRRLATIVIYIALGSIVVFAFYAAVVLLLLG